MRFLKQVLLKDIVFLKGAIINKIDKLFVFLAIVTFLEYSIGFCQNNLALESIRFAGNDSISTADLSSQIVLKQNNFLRTIMFWKAPRVFHQNILAQDLQRLQVYYQTEGFLKTQIVPEINMDENKKNVLLEFNISENSPVIVENVVLDLSSPDSLVKKRAWMQIEKIKKKLQLESRMRFRDRLLELDEKLLEKTLANDGFPYARLKTDLLISKNKESVNVTFRIETGPRTVLGETTVSGNVRVNAKNLLRQLAYKKGNIYSEEKLRKTQEQIFQLGVFNYVTVRALLEDSVGIAIPVEVSVNESPSWTTKFGVGYGKEDKFRTFIEFRKNGLFGSARRLVTTLKYSSLEPYNLNVKWIKPAFLYPRASITLNPFLRREKEPGFTVDRVGTNITHQQQLATFTDGYINYALEQDNLQISETIRLQGLGGQDISIYNKSSFTVGLARDSSLPPFNPTNGAYSAGSITYSGVGFQNDFHFVRFQLEGRIYRKVSDGLVVAARTKLGAMKATAGDPFTPLEERFYAGGSYSVRGWARSQLGPKSSKDIPIGGNSLLESSYELRFPVWGMLSGVIFMDMGNVWTNIGYDMADLHYASGAGLRFRTPIGPIRFDAARPVFESDSALQFHISIGQAF